LKVVVYAQPIDFRSGINGLTYLVSSALALDPYCGDIFVFRSKRRDRLKILTWDGTGMVLMIKWLEVGGFTWPPISGGVVRLGAAQMGLLLSGLDWSNVRPVPVKTPKILR